MSSPEGIAHRADASGRRRWHAPATRPSARSCTYARSRTVVHESGRHGDRLPEHHRVLCRIDPRSALVQRLGEHHDDAAGAADIGELVGVLVGGHAAQWVAAVPRGDLEGLVDVVDGEGDAVHADLVGPGGLRLDRVGVDVLKELEATVAVWRLEHGDVGMVAVEADGGVGPLSTDRVPAEDGQPEVREESNRRFEVADRDADVLESDGHALYATESRRPVQGRELPVLAQWGGDPFRGISVAP